MQYSYYRLVLKGLVSMKSGVVDAVVCVLRLVFKEKEEPEEARSHGK